MSCGDPTTNLTALKQSYNAGAPGAFTYQTTTVIRCVSGYKWPANQVETMTCGATGAWNYFVTCTGLLISLC